jgi:hypothetical protein
MLALPVDVGNQRILGSNQIDNALTLGTKRRRSEAINLRLF